MKPRLKGARLEGLRYEKRVARRISRFLGEAGITAKVLHAPWIRFTDQAGTNYCQPDIVVLPASVALPALCFEAKLTQTDDALQQLALYVPLLAKALNRPVIGVQVFRNIWRGEQATEEFLSSPLEALERAGLRPLVWHWPDRP